MAVSNTGQGNNWSNHYEVFIIWQGVWHQKLVSWRKPSEPELRPFNDNMYPSLGFPSYESALEMAEELKGYYGLRGEGDDYLIIPVHNKYVEELAGVIDSSYHRGYENGSGGKSMPF